MKSFAILKTDSVRPEWAERFGEYPDMFQTVLKRANPNLQFAVYDVQLGEYHRLVRKFRLQRPTFLVLKRVKL